MPPLIRFLMHPIGVYHSITPNEFVTSICQTQLMLKKVLTICMSLHFSDILDSAFFTVCGIWSLTGYLRETCLWISSNLPLYKKDCFSSPRTKLKYGQSVQETTNARIFVQGPHPCVLGFEYMPGLGSCGFADQFERKFETHFWQLIPWVLWGPETIILVLLHRSY